jgi:hypothetical protein
MKKQLSFKKTLLSSLIATAFVPAVGMADQLNFSTLPPGLISIKPTPNVIVTIDDSGSMSETIRQRCFASKKHLMMSSQMQLYCLTGRFVLLGK